MTQTLLVLEVNTMTATLRQVVDRIIRRRLGVNSPIIMLGSNVIYETGDDLEKDMVIQFEKNLDKV
jgi:ubiquitin-like 1-activating enzyme E1 B